MKKISVLMAAVFAVVTVLATGLTVLPSSVQDAQANPCSTNQDVSTSSDAEEGTNTATSGAATGTLPSSGDQDCKFIGNLEDAFDED